MAEPVELPEARVLRLQPGDIVVLTTDAHLSAEQAGNLKDLAAARFEGHPVVVLSGGVSIGSPSSEEVLDALAESLAPRIGTMLLKDVAQALRAGLT